MSSTCHWISAIAVVGLLSSTVGAQIAPAPQPGTPPQGRAPAAQTPTPAPARQQPPDVQPAPEPAPEARRDRPFTGRPTNIKLQVDIVDEGGPQPARKSVTLTVADRQSAFVRAEVSVPGVGNVPLSVDALPMLENDGKVRARISLDYRPNPGTNREGPTPATIRLAFGIILENGKTVQASQAADPVTDRRVRVEITATW